MTVRYRAAPDASARVLPAATATPRRRRMGPVRLVTQVYTSRSPSAAAFPLSLSLQTRTATVQYSTVLTYLTLFFSFLFRPIRFFTTTSVFFPFLSFVGFADCYPFR